MKKISKNLTYLAMAGAVAIVPCLPGLSAAAMSQDETVYAKLQNDGSAKYISVTKHLINDLKENELFDESILSELENLNGFENFTQDNGMIKWDANGKDIYYRGTTEKELPVQLQATYYLNGEEKPLSEILGKGGQIEIRLQYTNLSKVGNMYTPFVVAIATTLDETKVSNVKVANGRAVNNGRTIAIAAVAAPGLYESLGIADLKDTDTVTISYETKKFELGDIYSIVTPKLLDSADLKTFTELDDLYASSNKLAVSSKQLVEGTNSLKSGINELKNGILQAKQKLQKAEAKLDSDTLNKIKTTASTAAEKQAEAQRGVISANIKTQIESNEILMNALRLQAAEMCSAQIGGATCPEANLQAIQTQLMQGVEASMVESSMTLAKTTAKQTAAATAENVAVQVAETVQKTMLPAVSGALDTILAGVNKLTQGANELNNGMMQFDREGIQTLNNFVNGKVRVTANKVEQLVRLAEQYDNFAGITKGATGTTKFVLMIEGQK